MKIEREEGNERDHPHPSPVVDQVNDKKQSDYNRKSCFHFDLFVTYVPIDHSTRQQEMNRVVVSTFSLVEILMELIDSPTNKMNYL